MDIFALRDVVRETGYAVHRYASLRKWGLFSRVGPGQ